MCARRCSSSSSFSRGMNSRGSSRRGRAVRVKESERQTRERPL